MKLFGFGKKAEAPPPAPVNLGAEAANTIKNIRGKINDLEKRRAHLQAQIDDQNEKVKEKVRNKDKSGARMALVRKTNLEKFMTQVDNQMITMETQAMNLENQTTNLVAVKAMEEGLATTKKIQRAIDIEKVENIMDDIAEQNDQSNEIADLFAQNAEAMGGDMDLDAELEALSAQLLEEDLLAANVPPPTAIPSANPVAANPAAAQPAGVPNGPVATAPQPVAVGGGGMSAEEERQLAELQQALNFA